MDQNLSPLEIARQTLINLSKKQIPPTPENYARVYGEISGLKTSSSSSTLVQALEKILLESDQKDATHINAVKKTAGLVNENNLPKLEAHLRDLLKPQSMSHIEWGALLRYMLKQLDANHTGVTPERKKDALNRVIINFGKDPLQLSQKIQALTSAWGEGLPDIDIATSEKQTSTVIKNGNVPQAHTQALSTNIPATSATGEDLSQHWKSMLTRTIDLVVLPQFSGMASAENRVTKLIKRADTCNSLADVQKFESDLKSTLLRAEMQYDSLKRMQDALLEIMRLLVSSMSALTIEDSWLKSQITIVEEIIAKPLNIDTVYNAESSLKELISKQAQIRSSLIEANDSLRNMVSNFVSRLANITDSTGHYQHKIQGYQEQVSHAEKISDLNNILENLVSDIGRMNEDAKKDHDALEDTQKKVAEAEKKIQELSVKLDYINEIAHEDFLTGALNRRGMDEAIKREFERANRHQTTLSVTMLDIDHFKKLNDTLGHTTGDRALAHLAKVIKEIIRSTDVLARYGGEEFVILLPGTQQEDAINVVTGLQRELTKNFFLNNQQHVVITFSAGVAERAAEEESESVLKRADSALYIAKRTGRNRVVGAVPPGVDFDMEKLLNPKAT